MSTTDTPTPRTDAAINEMSRDVSGFTEFVAFARTLERELNAAQAARRDEESWWKEKHDYEQRATRAEAELAALRKRMDGVVKYCDERIVPDYKAVIESLKQDNTALRAALEECVYFADNSQGIVGWHLNGDILPWDQVEAIAQARAALAGGKEDAK